MHIIQKEKLIPLSITIGFHFVAVALLLLFRITAAEPKSQPKVELLLVNFGTTAIPMSGRVEPAASNLRQNEYIVPSESKPLIPPASSSSKSASSLINVTRRADAPMVPNHPGLKQEAQDQAHLRAEREARARERQASRRQAEQSRAIGEEISGAFGRGEAKASSQGEMKSQVGNQGARGGSGSSYSLEGRSVVSNGGVLSRPAYALAIRGSIRVRITVNSSGRVVQANVDPSGTDISDPNMRSAALSAAKNTRFNQISGGTDQRGAITYRYDIR